MSPRLTAYLFAVVALPACGRLVENGFTLEREGIVKYSDCRSTITLDADAYARSPRAYTCETRRTSSGQLMEATCVHVELADNGACNVAFVHQKITSVKCPDAAPWLEMDDKCYGDYERGRVFAGKR